MGVRHGQLLTHELSGAFYWYTDEVKGRGFEKPLYPHSQFCVPSKMKESGLNRSLLHTVGARWGINMLKIAIVMYASRLDFQSIFALQAFVRTGAFGQVKDGSIGCMVAWLLTCCESVLS